MTNVLFPCASMSPRAVEPDYADEHAAAVAAGFTVGFMDHSLVTSGEAERAVRFAATSNGRRSTAAGC
jgi:hypothetical protein